VSIRNEGYRQAVKALVAHLLLTRRRMLMQRRFEMLLGRYPQCCPQNAGITNETGYPRSLLTIV
jgi:hypothetical protein